MSIEWIEKKAAVTDSSIDVSISIRNKKSRKNRTVTAFSFSNTAITKRMGSPEYLLLGEDKDRKRIYFKPADNEEGYKLSRKADSRRSYFNVIHDWTSYTGDHTLKWDGAESMFFVSERG